MHIPLIALLIIVLAPIAVCLAIFCEVKPEGKDEE
jgi:hypothetical protein